MNKFILIVVSALLANTALVQADPAEWDAGPSPTAHLERAQFRWWAPPEAEKIRGILVIIPGRNGDARKATTDPEWQALASKQSFAIIGCHLFKTDPSYQSDPDGSTAKTILKAVSELAEANGHPEAASAPLAFWGSSAGANTAERFAYRHSGRTLAIANIKGTWGPGEFTPAKSDVPILCCIGKSDRPAWVETSTKFYEQGRQAGAVWTLAFHPVEGHSGGATKPLALAFLDEVITQRLGPPSSLSSAPKTLTFASGWLGDPTTLETAPAATFQGNKREATWLPGEVTAAAWKTYLSTSSTP